MDNGCVFNVEQQGPKRILDDLCCFDFLRRLCLFARQYQCSLPKSMGSMHRHEKLNFQILKPMLMLSHN
jgi:hypothetical protein